VGGAPAGAAAGTEAAPGSAPIFPKSFGVAAAVFGGLDAASRHLNDLHVLHAAGVWVWARVRTAGLPLAPRGSMVASSAPAISSEPSSDSSSDSSSRSSSLVLVFGGSSDWEDSSGGATRLHSDGAALDLSPCLAALARAAKGEPVAAAEPAGAAAAAATAVDGAAGGPELKRGPEGTGPAGGQAATLTPGTGAQVSKRKKAVPVRKLEGPGEVLGRVL
jgi:hypothetical protein